MSDMTNATERDQHERGSRPRSRGWTVCTDAYPDSWACEGYGSVPGNPKSAVNRCSWNNPALQLPLSHAH